MFTKYPSRWNLTPDGEPIITSTSHLLPVLSNGRPAMLKIALVPEEKGGGALMAWWNGNGAARVLARDDDAVLLERATGRSLAEMAHSGGDDEASRIICGVVARLHSPRDFPAPPVVPLTRWFQDLAPAAEMHGGILTLCAEAARALLACPQDETVLHGDIHHGNILDFGGRGWQAIDPKGLRGERGFDYANLFCNPDSETAMTPGRVARLAEVVAEAAGLNRQRLLRWVLAWSGLSAAWMISDGEAPDHTLEVAVQAATALGLRRNRSEDENEGKNEELKTPR